ncbi:MAG: hypothetical protein HOF38_01330 [Elusimicrobiaceae bacterium]|jgi:hypothetical protein|nr:hypothetical protein [Elusimicrobiaceae bacterium]MBT3954793.1 hypothetical protein [Elusimicrobiaceae bacterium]MBT4008787.1 hypothetical protein [Elusimicrobiaceae bacterium]MBT4402269.1 hypothetical protein [Elusimicrobiaceae bacterium]MBT4440274.1 hypothetical protein [Elusimicrobiaceae bacterium]
MTIHRNYIKIIISLVITLLLPISAFSEGLSIVKQSGTRVYIDTTEFKGEVSRNEYFEVLEEETLINKKTGKNLGIIENQIVDGKVVEVKKNYFIGRLRKDVEVKEDYIVRLFDEPKTEISNEEVFAAAPAVINKEDALIFKSQPLKGKMIDIDFISINTEKGKTKKGVIALFENGDIATYTIKQTAEEQVLEPVYTYGIGNFKQPISLEVFNKGEKAPTYVLVTVYDKTKHKVKTEIYNYMNNKLDKEDEVKFMVRSTYAKGKKTYYGQSVLYYDKFRVGPIAEVYEKNGKFKLKSEPIVWHKLDLVYGFNKTDLDKDEAGPEFLITTDNFRIRAQYEDKKIYVESLRGFGRTPNRLKWGQEIIGFYSNIPIVEKQGRSYVLGTANKVKRGLLTEKFSRYKNSKLYIVGWEDSNFKERNNLELGGYVYNFRAGEILGNKVVLIPVIMPTGKTKVKIISYEKLI